jgi:riboflavin synthase
VDALRQVLAKGYVMFTGLVEKIGTISAIEPSGAGQRLILLCSPWDTPPKLGESICVGGCCLTVVEHAKKSSALLLSFDVVPETLAQTTLGAASPGDLVNVERALRADGLLGGHQVQGHVDAVEQVVEVNKQGDGSHRVRFTMKSVDGDAVVPKGSITVDGISLTIASVADDSFDVALVPTTLQETTLGNTSVGDKVNIETDIIARTIIRVVRNMQS